MQSNERNPLGFPQFRVSDNGVVLYEALVAADPAHARALITAMHDGDVASRVKIEPQVTA